MRPRKFLLVTKALTTAGLVAACKKDDLPPPPGNPKGTWAAEHRDAAPEPYPGNPKGSTYDQAVPQPTPDAAPPPTSATAPTGAPPPLLPPGNPKGSHYDAGAGVGPTKPVTPIVGNTKGSHYDAGKPKTP